MVTLTRPKEPRYRHKKRALRQQWDLPRIRRTDAFVSKNSSENQSGLDLGVPLFLAVISDALRRSMVAGPKSSTQVWDSPGVKEMLEQPEGSSIDLSQLTEEEIDFLAQEAHGMWIDHPDIGDSVEWIRDVRKGLIRDNSGE